MKTFSSKIANTFFALFFAAITVSSFNSAQAQGSQNRITEYASAETATHYASQYESPKTLNSFTIENKARPGMAMGFSQYSAYFENNLKMVSYADGEEGQFIIESSFGNTIRIKNVINGKYLEIESDMAVNGAMVAQGSKRDTRSQLFQMVALGDGYYSLVSQLNYNLAIEISSKGNDFPLVLSNRKKSNTQAFKIVKN